MYALKLSLQGALILSSFFISAICNCQTTSTVRVASVLTKDYETVVSTDTRLLLNLKVDMQSADSFYGLRLPFVEFIAGLTAMTPITENDIEKAYSSLTVGAKNFKSPKGLGIVESNKCYVAIREMGVQPDLSADFSNAVLKSIDGRKVWIWSLPPDENSAAPLFFYAAQVGTHYFVMANSLEDFRETTRALVSAHNNPHQVPRILDWKNISTHSYWAYRRLRREGVSDRESAGVAHMGLDVKAISFSADLAKRESTVRVFSLNPEMNEIPNILPPSELEKCRPQGTGVWEASIPLTIDKTGYQSMFWLFAALGSGVYA